MTNVYNKALEIQANRKAYGEALNEENRAFDAFQQAREKSARLRRRATQLKEDLIALSDKDPE